MGISDDALQAIIAGLRSPHADKVYVAKEYTKADLIRDLERLGGAIDAELDTAFRAYSEG